MKVLSFHPWASCKNSCPGCYVDHKGGVDLPPYTMKDIIVANQDTTEVQIALNPGCNLTKYSNPLRFAAKLGMNVSVSLRAEDMGQIIHHPEIISAAVSIEDGTENPRLLPNRVERIANVLVEDNFPDFNDEVWDLVHVIFKKPLKKYFTVQSLGEMIERIPYAKHQIDIWTLKAIAVVTPDIQYINYNSAGEVEQYPFYNEVF